MSKHSSSFDSEIPQAHGEYDQKDVLDFFRLHVRLFGDDWRSLGWHSRATQFKRFEVLSAIGSLAGTRVLDVGCGLGDLYVYFQSQQLDVDYTGFDILPDMVSRARLRFPDLRFEMHDVLQGIGAETFDYILSSGAFNIDFGDNQRAIYRALWEMYQACTRGVAINFLRRHHSNNDPIFFHYDADALRTYCETFCSRVAVRSDYLPNDFTLYLYRNDEGG